MTRSATWLHEKSVSGAPKALAVALAGAAVLTFGHNLLEYDEKKLPNENNRPIADFIRGAVKNTTGIDLPPPPPLKNFIPPAPAPAPLRTVVDNFLNNINIPAPAPAPAPIPAPALAPAPIFPNSGNGNGPIRQVVNQFLGNLRTGRQ